MILGGVHARFGPIFHPDISFRPNAEIAFGEVTTQIGLNLEAVYRLPLNVRSIGNRNIDFGEFDWHTGFNVLTGLEYRNGMFIEFKATAYATPHFRMMIGYSF
jgi:hypothetical protein